MKTLLEKIEKMNAVIEGKQENCRKELIALCRKVCTITGAKLIELHRYYANNIEGDETTEIFYWCNGEEEFRTKHIDGWGYEIERTEKEARVRTQYLKVYLDNIQKYLAKSASKKEAEIQTIEFFEKFTENMKKTEEAQ